jgi:Xaa-Pro aminopeptidase
MNYKANVYFFRQDSSFLYFFGLDSAGLAAVIDVDEKKEILFGDDITVEDIVWMGPQPLLRDNGELVGVANTAPSADLAKILKTAADKGRKIHILPPYRPENVLKLQDLLGLSAEAIKKSVSEEFVKAVVAQRSVKSEEEVAQIEAALGVSRQMHITAMEMARPGLVERDIAGAIEGISVAGGGRPAFPVIVTVHGQILHNPYHGNVLEEGQMVLNDSGAESPMHYASDITRTFPVSGKFTPRQKELYQIVLDAQRKCIEMIKPGLMFKEVHLEASRILSEGLKGIGMMKGDVGEAVQEGAHALFFQCGLGHMMGLDVHDMEDLDEQYVGYDERVSRNPQFGIRHLRMAKALQPGYVMTVEPGLYFIPELIDRWKKEKKLERFIEYEKVEQYRHFGGIRVEDDVLVTDTGYRVLGESIPITIEEVEGTMAGAR